MLLITGSCTSRDASTPNIEKTTQITENNTTEKFSENNNSPSNTHIINQISFDINDTVADNIKRAATVLEKDKKRFEENVSNMWTNDFWEDTKEEKNMYCGYYIYYDKTTSNTNCNFKKVECGYYDAKLNLSDGPNEIRFIYEHELNRANFQRLDVDFIIEDVENTFGKLEDRKLFEDVLKEGMELYSNPDYENNESFIFNTASGGKVIINYTYEITVTGSYRLELPEDAALGAKNGN
jgi:hypothetical protein